MFMWSEAVSTSWLVWSSWILEGWPTSLSVDRENMSWWLDVANGSHLANHTDIAHKGVCASLRHVCHVAALQIQRLDVPLQKVVDALSVNDTEAACTAHFSNFLLKMEIQHTPTGGMAERV